MMTELSIWAMRVGALVSTAWFMASVIRGSSIRADILAEHPDITQNALDAADNATALAGTIGGGIGSVVWLLMTVAAGRAVPRLAGAGLLLVSAAALGTVALFRLQVTTQTLVFACMVCALGALVTILLSKVHGVVAQAPVNH